VRLRRRGILKPWREGHVRRGALKEERDGLEKSEGSDVSAKR
jgi:hypothetical protein